MKAKLEIKLILELDEKEVKWLKKATVTPLIGDETAAEYEIRTKFFDDGI